MDRFERKEREGKLHRLLPLHDSLPPSYPPDLIPSPPFLSIRFENGGFLPQCNQALAFAKGASELRCYAKATLADGSVNRGPLVTQRREWKDESEESREMQ